MSPNAARPPRVFLSRTTAGLAPLAQEIATLLRSRCIEVELQTDFLPDWRSVPQMLQHRLMQCDSVLALIGPAHGAEPAPHLQPAHLKDACTHGKSYSFTQWEYLVARDLARPTFTFLVTGPDLITPFDPESPDLAQRQQQFITDFAKDRSLLYYEYTDRAKLLAHIQQIDFPLNVSAGRPQNLPYNTLGTLFKGRHDFLSDLHTQLTIATSGTDAGGLTKNKTNATAAVIRSRQAIHGMGGVGKTRAAVEYAWARAETYRALLFATADSPESLQRNLAALCGPLILNLPQQLERETEAQLNAVLHWLNQNPGWLLILDNVDTPEAQTAVRELSVKLPHGHLLITSTRNDWPRGFTGLELDVLTQPASIAFLLDHTAGRRAERPNEDPVHAATIAHHLGGHALALEQAAAYVRVKRRTLADYLTAWENERNTLLGQPLSKETTDYDRTLLITYNLSVAQLDHAAKKLLQILSWLAPDPIPTSAFANLKETIPDPQQSLEDLTHLHLARPNPESTTTTLHRLTQELTRQQQEQGEVLGISLRWMNIELPDHTDEVLTWPIAVPLLPHVIAVANRVTEFGIAKAAGRLMGRAGLLLLTQARYGEAESLIRHAINIYEATSGKDSPQLATELNNLGALLQATNRPKEAEPLMRRALAMDEASYGPQHPIISRDLGNLASLLLVTNSLKEAELLMRRALAIDESCHGPDHANSARSLNNLAALLQAAGQYVEAETLMRRALSIGENSYGSAHPDVATNLNNLSTLMQETSRSQEAEPLLRRALAINEASFGPTHPKVAIVLNNLAQTLLLTDRLTEAEFSIRRALAIDEACYGPTHPEVAKGLNNLARILQFTDRLNEAISIMMRVLAADNSNHGLEHPRTATTMNNLAVLLLAADRLEEAEPLMLRALTIHEADYGPEHIEVAGDLNNIASLLCRTNRFEEAEPFLRRVLGIFIKFHSQTGLPHPHIQTTSTDYFTLLQMIGYTKPEAMAKMRALANQFGVYLKDGTSS